MVSSKLADKLSIFEKKIEQRQTSLQEERPMPKRSVASSWRTTTSSGNTVLSAVGKNPLIALSEDHAVTTPSEEFQPTTIPEDPAPASTSTATPRNYGLKKAASESIVTPPLVPRGVEQGGECDDQSIDASLDLHHDILMKVHGPAKKKAPYSHHQSFTAFEEQMRIARDRERRRVEALNSSKISRDLSSTSERSSSIVTGSKIEEEGDDKLLEMSINIETAAAKGNEGCDDSIENSTLDSGFPLDQERTYGASYTGDFGLTSFEEQMKIARERERKRQQAQMKKQSQSMSSLSLKDRMKAFQK